MDTDASHANPPDPALVLTQAAYRFLLHTLRTELPPPETDAPEALMERDNAAIAQVAAMLPVNADEAYLAAQCVAARAQAADAQRLAGKHRDDVACYLKCSAQASRMSRDADRSRALLQRLQAERRRLEKDPAACETNAWTEHCTIGLMTRQAVPERPPLSPEPEPQLTTDEPQRDLRAEAEMYAAVYPERAALIRRQGRVPANVNFGPPDDALVVALVTGRTPVLLALDLPERLAS